MSKKLVNNALSEQMEQSAVSGFLNPHSSTPTAEEQIQTEVKKAERIIDTTVRDVPPVLPVPPTLSDKRVMKQRHPFDIYQDQYESLKELALDDRMQGGIGSMSAMVREALDSFIKNRKK